MTMTPRDRMEFNEQNATLESQTKNKVSQVTEQAQQKAKEITEQAQEQAKSAVATRKEQAVEGLGGIAQAFRETGEKLREGEQETVANYTEQVASQIERFSNYLNERDVDELLGEAESFARRHPEVFLGGALALGLLVGRFIKSSGERREIVRAGYYHPSSYPPAPAPNIQGTMSNAWEPGTSRPQYSSGTMSNSWDTESTRPQSSYRPQVNNPDVP